MEFFPGDIVEIATDKGLAYVQVTHRHASYPEVIRVLPSMHESRPKDISALAGSPALFSAMFPLSGAIAKGRISGEKVGTATIPVDDRPFPTFKMPIRDKQGNIAYWWFWDGEGLRYDTEPGSETDRYPMREVIGVEKLLASLK